MGDKNEEEVVKKVTRLSIQEIGKLVNKGKSDTRKFLDKYKKDIHKYAEIILDIPYEIGELNRFIYLLFEEKKHCLTDIHELTKILKKEFYGVKANKFKTQKDANYHFQNNDDIIDLKFKVSGVDIAIGIIERCQDSIVEIRTAVNAYANMKNTGV